MPVASPGLATGIFILEKLSFQDSYGHGVAGVDLFRAVGAVAGLLKSAELMFVSIQLVVLIVDRAFWFVLVENGAGPAPS